MNSDRSLSLINELRRKNSKEIILAYIEAGEVVGADEVILKRGRREASLKVSSEEVIVLYIEHKDFLERIFNPYPYIKHLLCERLELKKNLHDSLEYDAKEFVEKNTKPLKIS